MTTGPTLRAAALHGYADLARSYGLEPDRLMRSVGLDPAVLDDQDRRIPARAVNQLLELSAARAGAEDFSLRLAELRSYASLGPLGLVAREEPDLRSALEVFLTHLPLHNEALLIRLEEHAEVAVLRVEVELGTPMETRQATTLAVGVLVRILRQFLGGGHGPELVCFTYASPRDPRPWRRLLGAVAFGQEFNGVVFRRDLLAAPNPMAEPALQRYARDYLGSIARSADASATSQARRMIQALVPTGGCTVEAVAAEMGVTRRTLHRRLAQEGETYAALLDAVRRDLACLHVENPARPLAEVADILGFASPSALTKWFRGQFGCSPSEWRRRAGAGPGG